MDPRSSHARRTHPRRVVVIGAGVSGCSAALALASRGVPVLLLNSGLDSVGLPGYGPAVTGSARIRAEGHSPPSSATSEDVLEALREAAPALRDVWLAHAWTYNTAIDDAPRAARASAVVVDRRSVSLGTKWRVENEELIELRQGLAVSVEEQGEAGVIVRTVFGEEFRGRAALVAVGLAFGGRICVGEQETAGGRYGEVAADALLDDLLSQGVHFEAVERGVGARLQSVHPHRTPLGDPVHREAGDPLAGASSKAFLVEVELTPVALPEGVGSHGPETEGEMLCRPPSPYDRAEARGPRIAYALGTGAVPSDPGWSGAHAALALLPDGIATGEWYLAPEAVAPEAVAGGIYGPTAVALEVAAPTANGETIDQFRMGAQTRPPHTVRGFVASGGEGKILPGVWVAGQAAGASGYVASLSSGRRVSAAIADEFARDESQR